jgi:beta-lactamase regulating signal transducer with metallopeptidase domain
VWGWVDRLGSLVFRASVAAAVLSSLAMLLMLGCQQPARRIALARAALCGTLVVIVLLAFAPLPRFDTRGALQATGVLSHPLVARAQAMAALGLRGPWPGRVVLFVYLGGVGTFLAELAVGYWGLGWLTRCARAPSLRAQAVYDAIPFSGLWAWGWGRARPRLRVTARVRRPVLLGTFHPTILIPPALDLGAPHADAGAESTEALRLSLLHELAHAERLDPGFSLVGSLARAFWFVLPPVWWIRAQMQLDQEFLADRRAARTFGAPEAYAAALVAIAGPPAEPSAAVPAGPAPAATAAEPSWGTDPTGSPGSPLFQRILMLVSCPFRVEHRPPPWWRWPLPILTLVITPLAACLCVDLGTGPLPAAAVAPQPRTFRVARLAMAPRNPGPGGRAAVHELPLVLPAEFDLSLEVWSNRAALTQCRVIGLRLAPHGAVLPAGSETSAEAETWHRVQIQRTAQALHVSVLVDGQPVPHDSTIDRVTTRLTVEPPPGRPAWFRNIRVDWKD